MNDKRTPRGLNLFRIKLSSIKIEMNSFEEYINDTTQTLNKKQRELEKEYQKQITGNEGDEEVDMFLSEEHQKYHKTFPAITYNSILVSQFSFFENELRDFCDLDARKNFSKIKISDLYGSDIEKCKRYITLVAEINFEDFDEIWKQILIIQNLRNSIVHKSSKLDSTKSHIIKFVKSEKRLKYNEELENFYVNDPSFLINFNILILEFFKILVNKLSSKKVIARNTTTPFDNANWGKEKTETLLKDVIHGNFLITRYESRNDEHNESDFKESLKGVFNSMTNNLTKLMAFFYDGDWDAGDSNRITEEGKEGLEHIKKIYNQE